MSDRFPFPIPDGWFGLAYRKWAAEFHTVAPR